MEFLMVGLGGAAGAILRYLISLIPLKSTFPLLTFATNLLGAILIGVIAACIAKSAIPANLGLLMKTGFCGGFTTFSTFSLESLNLIQNKEYASAGLYMVLSVALCVIGVLVGEWLANSLAH